MIFKKSPSRSDLDTEIAGLTASIQKHEVREFDAKRALATAVDKREALLNDPKAAIEDFIEPNKARNAATTAIEHAQRVLPGMRKRREALLQEKRKLIAADYRAQYRPSKCSDASMGFSSPSSCA
ncbi:MAG: hypothetical protein WBX14_01665 [Candidatus Udaeobacter sp.]